ncbi:MAG TPA: LPS export ABC transporter periplasmic protein LptC [Acetobacteraceae bacterium]|jgi:lipopolysaccharide export system protein LptC|nr:LPS export ABC transporter periplasmic protein LptC [Acetobacteraceae bacterium]
MSTTVTDRRPGGKLIAAAAARLRRPPTPRHLARRQLAIKLTKFMLPALALALLSAIALWPEFNRATEEARAAFRRISAEVQGGELIDARYHGIDDKGRPYTLTAATAQQDGPERVNLTTPKGDITLENGTWLMLHSKDGVYMQHLNELDLSHDVTLYRDDGTTMVTASAAIDMKNGAAAGAQPVHAEGPFGTLESVGFTLVDKGANIQFGGPAHLVLNGATVGAAAPAAAPADAPPAPPAAAHVQSEAAR